MPLTKIQSLGITDGTIVNADINASAAIAGTKLSGVGKVLQVITATDATQRTSTSTSFVTISNTLSVTITPSSASNKIFILASPILYSPSGQTIFATIFKGATNLGGSNGMAMATGNIWINGTMNYLDSPATTSATTYQVYFRGSGGTFYVIGDTPITNSITAFEIAA
jgi:hypothetical protein